MDGWKKATIIGGLLGFFGGVVIDYLTITTLGNRVYLDIYIKSYPLPDSLAGIIILGIPILFSIIGTLLTHKFYLKQ